MIINRENIDALNTGFRTSFNNAFAGTEPMWNRVAMEAPSTTAKETYGWLGSVPAFREWIGDRVYKNLEVHDFTIRNRKFEMTVLVPRDAVEDDTYGVYTPFVSEMGRASKVHPDELVFPLLGAGFDTPCYDGQYFFDTDHPVLDKSGAPVSVSNSGGGSGAPWFLLDTTRAVRPFIWQPRRPYDFKAKTGPTDENVFDRDEYVYGVDTRCNSGYGLWQLAYGSKQTLDATNYAAARTAMMGMKGDYERPLGLRPKLLVVPPSLEGKALELIQAERLANGATNVYRNTAEVFVCPWL
ncbi:MAG: Mu-like prophage major head subunit gpT family protein [Parvibaculaceae bacterium]|nr:Mu-like prophage major head subunit gpT family protein [Parvibaculaceae bacterium]